MARGSRFWRWLSSLRFRSDISTAAQAAPAIQSGLSQPGAYDANGLPADAVDQSARQQPAPDHDSGQQPADNCAICAVMALANNVLFATPPLLLLPQAVEFLYQTTDAEFVHLNSARVAFQPRAPPALLTSID